MTNLSISQLKHCKKCFFSQHLKSLSDGKDKSEEKYKKVRQFARDKTFILKQYLEWTGLEYGNSYKHDSAEKFKGNSEEMWFSFNNNFVSIYHRANNIIIQYFKNYI